MSRADREIITPADRDAWLKLRVADVTSTESAMLFGLSPYGTHFELWHHKADEAIVEIDPNERMEWGTDLQNAIAAALARRYGVVAVPMPEYMRLTGPRMGASFDWRVVGINDQIVAADTRLQEMFKQHGPGLLEIKNVDGKVFRDQWIKRLDDEDTGGKIIEPPGHIDVQVQHQLHVAGLAWTAIGVLVGGNKSQIVTRLYDPQVGAALETRIVQFWDTVKTKQAPQPVFPGDAEFVSSLYGEAVDSTFDGRGNEELRKHLDAYSEALNREKLAKEDKQVAHAQALTIIGNAGRAIVDGYTVSATMVGPCHVSYHRKGYRGWKVTKAKS